jgi:hypothetical protein
MAKAILSEGPKNDGTTLNANLEGNSRVVRKRQDATTAVTILDRLSGQANGEAK